MKISAATTAITSLLFFYLTTSVSAAIHAPASSTTKQPADIDTQTLHNKISNEKDLILIDVRTPGEVNFLGGSIAHPGEINIPRGWLEFRINDQIPDLDTPIVVYCGINARSPLAAKTLTEMGYTNVTNYKDAFKGWKAAGNVIKTPDAEPNSMLYNKPVEVIKNVYSAIGETAPGSYANSGHNNNLSFIVTDEGVLVFNAGDNYLLAKALHEEIQLITDKPIKYVVLENGQGHAMLGSSYWKDLGVPIIAHVDSAHEIQQYGEEVIDRMRAGRRDKALGTVLTMPDRTFDDKMEISLGGVTIELLDLGPSHSPGDIMLWLPEEKLIITGDMAFHQRLLPVFENTDTGAWLDTWEKFAALNAVTVIPGHGDPTNMEEVTKYTKGYLTHMRSVIGKVIDDGGDLQDAYTVDQASFSHLPTYKLLYKQNAGRIFRAMEFE